MNHALRQLAQTYRLELSFHDSFGQQKEADEEAVARVLSCLGAELSSPEGAESALMARRVQLLERWLEPVYVHWVREDADADASIVVGRPPGHGDAFQLELIAEGGERRVVEGRLSQQPEVSPLFDGATARRRVSLGDLRSVGYHQLVMHCGDASRSAALFAAPLRCHSRVNARDWGVFAPTYALSSRTGSASDAHSVHSDMGVGDIGQLRRLVDWVGARGGQTVSTLPLLSQFLDEIFEPSPYSPSSRLFWNELYLDLASLPELAASEEARRALSDSSMLATVRRLQESSSVDYAAWVTNKRRVLEQLAAQFYSNGSDQTTAFREFCQRRHVMSFARFRATGETQRAPFQIWPHAAKQGQLDRRFYDESRLRYHLYCQFRVAQQMEALGDHARSYGLGLYLDLPVGVHSSGYDLWAEADAFLSGCSAGAPPDIVFTSGQDWGTAPLSPEGSRDQEHRYFRDVIAHHLRCAGALRIDHVMGLQRIYCVPVGLGAQRGVYVGYPTEELLAVLLLEAHRNRASLVGEDLGTVPPEIPATLERHGIRRMHVLEYALAGDHVSFHSLTSQSVASVNTHDLFPFSGWCAGLDLDQRSASGLLSSQVAEQEKAKRSRVLGELVGCLEEEGHLERGRIPLPVTSEDTQELLEAVLRKYGMSEAPLVLVNLEDLWGEKEPQNVPGTSGEAANWRKKLRYPLAELARVPGLERVLKSLDESRRHAASVADSQDQ